MLNCVCVSPTQCVRTGCDMYSITHCTMNIIVCSLKSFSQKRHDKTLTTRRSAANERVKRKNLQQNDAKWNDPIRSQQWMAMRGEHYIHFGMCNTDLTYITYVY